VKPCRLILKVFECLTDSRQKGSQLMGKVCDLCRGLETNISVMLVVKSSLDISFDWRYSGYIHDDGLMMMTLIYDFWYYLYEEVPFGIITWDL
jgi:hypothetical protein